MRPVPYRVLQMVNGFVSKERGDVAKYDNREFLDESCVWDLHELARMIYAAGWTEGFTAHALVEQGRRL